MTEPTDTDIPGLAGAVQDAQDRLLEHYKATTVSIDTHDGDDEVTLRLNFRGFRDFDTAIERVTEVARSFDSLPETTGVHAGANSEGGYDPRTEEEDDRPAGWVNATLEPGRALLAEEDLEADCTCGPNEACDVCGGQ